MNVLFQGFTLDGIANSIGSIPRKERPDGQISNLATYQQCEVMLSQLIDLSEL